MWVLEIKPQSFEKEPMLLPAELPLDPTLLPLQRTKVSSQYPYQAAHKHRYQGTPASGELTTTSTSVNTKHTNAAHTGMLALTYTHKAFFKEEKEVL